MIALNRAWIASSASPHVIRSKRPSPRAPTRRSGVRRRPAPWTNAGYACGTFAQSTPPVYGLACEPRIPTIRSSSTVTVRLQVSGQSSGQTLGRSTLTAAIVLESGGTAEGGNAPVLLQGIRVVEAASMVLVPSAAAMLADFGAEVIKVEPPEGDYNRKMHELPTLPQSEAPYCFLVDGRSKQSIVLDLKSTDGVAILHKLVSTTDVFLTNYRAPALARLRLRWDDLAPLNPRLVYASASAFGESGPEADKPGYDTVVYWARSGLESSLLTPEGTLGQLAGGAGDHPTALALFGAVALALFARERSGRGLKVGTSLLAAGAWANSWNIQAQLCGATFPPKLPRAQARGFGRLVTVDSPISVTGVPKAPPRAAPDLGQHTREVLTGLGYTDPQIRDFLGRGVAVQG